jgi:hypothetical protein
MNEKRGSCSNRTYHKQEPVLGHLQREVWLLPTNGSKAFGALVKLLQTIMTIMEIDPADHLWRKISDKFLYADSIVWFDIG